MKFYFDKRVAIGFSLTLAILFILGLFSLWSISRLINSSKLLIHGASVITTADLVVKSVIDTETGERGFVITGQEEFLEPFKTSGIPIVGYLRKLDSLAAGNSLQAKRVDTLKLLVAEDRALATNVIGLRRESFEKAQIAVAEGHGRRVTDSIRALVIRLQDEERAIFKKGNSISGKSLAQFQYSFGGLLMATTLIIIYLFYLINKTLKARKEVETRMVQTNEESRDLYDNAPCGYLAFDSSFGIKNINSTLLKWLGYAEGEIIAKMKLEDLFTQGGGVVFQNVFAEKSPSETTSVSINDLEFDFRRKNKTSFPVIVNSTAIFSTAGKFMSGRSTVIDNTERKKADDRIRHLNQDLELKVEDRTRKLAESEQMYKSLASNIPGSAISVIDQEERFLFAEGDMLESLGYHKESMPGKRMSEIMTPENYELFRPLIKRAFSGEIILNERQTPSGLHALMKVVPLRSASEDVFAIMFVLIDVTEMKNAQAELARLNDSLESRIAERTVQLKDLNKELEAFTYSVSHDLRAPLRAISGYAQMIAEDYPEALGAEGQRINNLIISNGLRMGKLIDDLLDFSRLGRKELMRSKINMDALVREIIQDLVPQEGDRRLNIKVLTLHEARGDLSMIRQVWVNLISNALKYTGKKEISEINISSAIENENIVYSISDNGAGFDMAHASKLFGVFQRLHKMTEFEGTGVGLALVNTIVRRHGGQIYAEAKINEGATFHFTLPLNI